MTSYFKILENKGHVKNKGVKIVDNENGCGIYNQGHDNENGCGIYNQGKNI